MRHITFWQFTTSVKHRKVDIPGIITREEVADYREEVRSSPKYAGAINKIESQMRGFEAAKDNPQEYLKALFKAKMDGKIR